MKKEEFVGNIILGVFIAIAGISIGLGFYNGRKTDRYVTVKGLAQREVKADLAIWPISFKVVGNDLNTVEKSIEQSRKIITEFLVKSGLSKKQINYSAPKIRDLQSEMIYGSGKIGNYRYVSQSTVTARTKNVDIIKQAMENAGQIVGKGIIFEDQSWKNPTEFIYTKLNQVKPEMIEEATVNARKAAEKFAKDSGSKVGKIKNASQGYFSIKDRDKNTPDIKKVRVVTTVKYYLID